jgi:hypothetical protein
MSTVKRTAGDYTITTVDGSLYVNTQNFTIDGNLIVTHSIANVEAINNYVYENYITLQAGNSGGPILDAGIVVDRGVTGIDPPALRWHEATQQWELNDTTGWSNFGHTTVYQDKTPKLGGNLDVNGYHIWSSKGNVTFDSIIRIQQITSDPAPSSGYSTIYAKAADDGNTGLYISNEKKVAEELITKRKALLYSLIL